jgi:riboflavin synthase
MKPGDSVAVNGVCLTVTDFSQDMFSADVMNETLSRSGLGSLSAGSRVNLERAMPANGRFGGHIVSGHIDGNWKIVKKERAITPFGSLFKQQQKL